MKKVIIEHFSESIGFRKNLICLVPNDINEDTKCLTLLHGLSDNECAFLDYTNIFHLAQKHNLVVIMPSTDRGFYTNMANGYKYYDYISQEIYEIIESTLNINLNKMKHLIGGFSMGGYGAIKIALTSNRYIGVVSFAGVLDITQIDMLVDENNGLMSKSEWKNVFPIIDSTDDVLQMEISNLNVLLYVGDNDFLYEQSLKFKEVHGNSCELIVTKNEGHDWFFINNHLEDSIVKLL